MFHRLGSFPTRFRWYVILTWVIAAAVLTLVAPNIDDVSVSDQRAYQKHCQRGDGERGLSAPSRHVFG